MTEKKTTAVFMPIVTVQKLDDGRTRIEFDWGDSFEAIHPLFDAGDFINYTDEEEAAYTDVMDRWTKKMPKVFFVDPVTTSED